MAKLKWRQSRDSWKVNEAFASRGTGRGRYQICWDGNNGCTVHLDWGIYQKIGETGNVAEAIALAQTHNDQRLAAAISRRSGAPTNPSKGTPHD